MSRSKNTRKVSLTRSIRFETLEDRKLMAGDVDVRLVNGEAMVTGDSRSNGVWIHEIKANTYRVEGLTVGGSSTRVNGKAYFDIYTREDDLKIDMGNGNDMVLIGNQVGATAMTVEDLTIKLGNGNDTLHMANLSVYDKADPVKINTGVDSSSADNDDINIDNAKFAASIDIIMGAGLDECVIRNTTIRDDLKINTGSGDDQVEIVNVSMDECFIEMGSGSDELELERVKARRMNANGGKDLDLLELRKGNQFGTRSFVSFNEPT